MKDVTNYSENLARGDDGLLYRPGVRASMEAFTTGGGTAALEAAAAVRAAAQAVERLRSHGAGGRGLSAGALDVLTRLGVAGEEGLPLGELARAAGMSPRNATGLVDTLERDGLVRRVQDRRDRRSVRAEITPAGRDWLESFRAPTQRAMSAVFQGLTDDDLARLRHLCLCLVENQQRIEAYLNPSPPDPRTA
ncbi:MarR family winged helix-turn-helix transcriptional regulator [Streptomyces sp. NRRL S-87]|uniref:MarR family winged helix-turn-helix transcriptional regulator n=1 Tax=Streptomyces sp. NRRL S-87 TaxID=1463920 RepID=UPI0004C1D7E2|nr:MarR family transcriptional regulator [Streptomyces sp. NRRL S-87]